MIFTITENKHESVEGEENGGSCIIWNPNQITHDGKDYITLAHELAHSLDRLNGTRTEETWFQIRTSEDTMKSIRKTEIFALHIENPIRAEHGLKLRERYMKKMKSVGTSVTICF